VNWNLYLPTLYHSPIVISVDVLVKGGPMDGKIVQVMCGTSIFLCEYLKPRDARGIRLLTSIRYNLQGIFRRPEEVNGRKIYWIAIVEKDKSKWNHTYDQH